MAVNKNKRPVKWVNLLKPQKTNTMKSFLIMVAAVVIGVIVAGVVKTKILKQPA